MVLVARLCGQADRPVGDMETVPSQSRQPAVTAGNASVAL